MFVNGYANSNWVYVDANEIGDKYFVDKNSIQKQGYSITFWVRTNYKERDNFGDLSSKIQRTINCRTREQIGRYFMFYDDVNNDGQVTGNTKPQVSSWTPVAPDTVFWGLFKFACS